MGRNQRKIFYEDVMDKARELPWGNDFECPINHDDYSHEFVCMPNQCALCNGRGYVNKSVFVKYVNSLPRRPPQSNKNKVDAETYFSFRENVASEKEKEKEEARQAKIKYQNSPEYLRQKEEQRKLEEKQFLQSEEERRQQKIIAEKLKEPTYSPEWK